ncbi:DUF1772 domain-containing protein [Plantactinospora sp. B6F1]|uniref:anthrone oxygenase family protein n=1 Tax=Plantactinospora sp. B6F1 TaxID=3158971 RepID=UPI0032D92A03
MTGAVLGAAAMTTGLVAGVFTLYAHTIMPGLGGTDDRTFVGAFQSLDRSIINPWFMSCFLGALVLTGISAALHLPADGHGGLPWTAVAFVLYLVVVVITLAVNVPRNDAIKAAGDPDQIDDLAGVRRDFGEARWRAWNLVRVVLSLAAFGCLLVALVRYGGRG